MKTLELAMCAPNYSYTYWFRPTYIELGNKSYMFLGDYMCWYIAMCNYDYTSRLCSCLIKAKIRVARWAVTS